MPTIRGTTAVHRPSPCPPPRPAASPSSTHTSRMRPWTRSSASPPPRCAPDPTPRAPPCVTTTPRPKSPRLQASALPRQHAPISTDDPTPSHQHHVTQRKSPDDIVVVSALRTPITRAKKGGLKDTPADDLVATLLKATVDRTGLDTSDVGDVVVGSVLGNSSQRANECRIAMFLAGFPQEVPVRTVNRQCSSGLQACADVAGEYFFVL